MEGRWNPVGRWRGLVGACLWMTIALMPAWSAGALPRAYALVESSGSGGKALEGLFGGIEIPEGAADTLNDLYTRHRLEIMRMINDNPSMAWESIEVALDALPALRRIPENAGRLCIDRKVYHKATGILDEMEALASPGLSEDLRRTRALLESRARETDSGKILIDLNL